MIDLCIGILEIFAEAAKPATEDAFTAASRFVAMRTALGASTSKTYRERMARDPEKLRREHERQARWRAENPHYSRDYKRVLRGSKCAQNAQNAQSDIESISPDATV